MMQRKLHDIAAMLFVLQRVTCCTALASGGMGTVQTAYLDLLEALLGNVRPFAEREILSALQSNVNGDGWTLIYEDDEVSHPPLDALVLLYIDCEQWPRKGAAPRGDYHLAKRAFDGEGGWMWVDPRLDLDDPMEIDYALVRAWRPLPPAPMWRQEKKLTGAS